MELEGEDSARFGLVGLVIRHIDGGVTIDLLDQVIPLAMMTYSFQSSFDGGEQLVFVASLACFFLVAIRFNDHLLATIGKDSASRSS